MLVIISKCCNVKFTEDDYCSINNDKQMSLIGYGNKPISARPEPNPP